jgi:hypothetical protein
MPRLSVPGFVDGSNTERSPQAQIGRTINEFVESTQPGGGTKAPGYLQGTPGIHPLLVWPDQPIRGLFTMNERAFVVGGGLFGEFFADGTIGTTYPVTNDGRPVSFASNGSAGNQILFSSGGDGYIYNTLTNTFTQVTDPDFPNPCKMVEFLNGYFLALQGGGSRSFSWSNLEDGLVWDPLDVAERSSTGDNLAAMIRIHEELWFLGGQTSQVYVNTGVASEIFAPVSGVVIEQGTSGAFSVQRLDNTLFWCGLNVDGARVVYRAQGYTPTRISTFGVEQDLQQYSDDGQALTFQMNGHYFYALIQPQNRWTWLYDVTMDRWVNWAIWNTTTAEWEPHVVGSHVFCFEAHFVGDRLSGAIYDMRMSRFTDEIVAPT